MTGDVRWEEVRGLFERALDEQPSPLDAWLDREAGADAALRAEVESLLRHHREAGSFLVEPIANQRPDLLVEDASLEPDQRVGAYVVVREIGRGGMGRVYLARDTRLGRDVALKAVSPDLLADRTQRERLRREARAAAALSHPGICTIYALEEIGDNLFIAAEYVEGQTLHKVNAAGPRPAAGDVGRTARELAAALAHAHTRHVVHRDLKPENVMRTTDGRLKILDFGLARIVHHDGDNEGAHVTEPGTILGTPGYMAPEQLSGLPVGARADVFALGVLVYEYACGIHPFDAPTPLAVAGRILESDPLPLHERRPDLPATLTAVVDRCLRKAPVERFADAADVAAALNSVANAGPGGMANWWRIHQIMAVALYLGASALAWQIKEWQPGITTGLFVFICVVATIAAVFRAHLLFTAGVNEPGLTAERGRARPITLTTDLLLAAALAVDGLLLSATQPLAGALTIALAVGIALARLVVEPSTTSASFK